MSLDTNNAMNDTDNFAGLVQQGLNALERGLSSLLLTSTDQARSEQDRTGRLQSIISEIDSYYGHDSRTFLLAHWALQLHSLLHTNAYELTSETTLCDLERLKELADFFSLRDVSDQIRESADQIAVGTGSITAFPTVSGGFANLSDLTAATLHAINERMELLGGSDFRESISSEVELLETLANEDLAGRYILDASQDRRRLCASLATMVMVIRQLQRLGETGSGTAAVADAQRLAQLGELVGITPVNILRNPLPKDRNDLQSAEQKPSGKQDPDVDPQAESALFPDTEPAEPVKRSEEDEDADDDLTVDVASRHLPEPPPEDPEWEPHSEPEHDVEDQVPATTQIPVDQQPDNISTEAQDPDAEIAEALAETEAPGQGLGQMLLMVLMVVVGIGIVALVVIRPTWLETLSNQGQLGDTLAVTPEPETLAPAELVEPTATSVSATADPEPSPLPPTPTPEPIDGYVFLTTTANVYRWPDFAAEVIGTREAESGVVLVRQITDGDQLWLQMEDTFFIQAEAVSNPDVIQTLVQIEKADLLNIPEEFLVQQPPENEQNEGAETPDADAEEATTEEPDPEPTPDERTLVTQDEEVRIGPGVDFPSRGIQPADSEVTLIGTNEDGSWSLMANYYWIPTVSIVSIPDGLPVVGHPTANANANLRAAPDQSSDQLGVVDLGTALPIDGWALGTNPDGVWYHLDTGEWIFGELVQDAYQNLPERPYVPEQ